MDVTLLVNPSAGRRAHTKKGIRKLVEAAGHRVKVAPPKGKDLRRELKDPGDLVVAAGGDGTVSRIVKELAGSDVPVAILPLGTANNIAKSLGVQGEIEDLVARWATASQVRLEIGSVWGPWGETQFVESVGLGLLARMMSPSVARDIEGVEDARVLMERMLGTFPLTHWRVELDGQDLSGDYLLVEGMNLRCAGPNLCMVQHEHTTDGRLSVVVAGDADRKTLRSLARPAELGSVLVPHRGRRLTLWCKRQELHVDHTYGEDLRAPKGDIQVDAELSGLGVNVLV